MLLERYYDDTLAQASYLIGCEQTREAIVIDPNLLQNYQGAARAHRMRIRYVAETHIHADFLSGSRDLASAARATLLLSGCGGKDWSYRVQPDEDVRIVREGETIRVGNVRLLAMHTPGHTPEHLCFLVTDSATGSAPMGLVSGDFLFVGDVGRPDLLERAAKMSGTMDQAARQLFRSLRRLTDLPDYLQVWPGHGAGSACGKALGSVPQTTLGYERLYNPALQFKDEDAFAQWVLADQPEPPPYFAIMKQWNRDGRPAREAADSMSEMDATDVLAAIEMGHQVVDVRSVTEFGRAHIMGTINIPASRSLATYAGTVLRYDRPVVLLVTSTEQLLSVRRQLASIGIDVVGSAGRAVVDELTRGGHTVPVLTIDPPALADKLEHGAPMVIDVRGRSEWKEGHLARAQHVYLGDLAERAASLQPDAPIVVHCQSGARSSIAASMLMARGFTHVTNLVGGVDAWRKAGLPLTSGE